MRLETPILVRENDFLAEKDGRKTTWYLPNFVQENKNKAFLFWSMDK